uniref:glucan endo-1,3-beta-D-glucosidase n=1 Tax=Brassica oleracea TaxID=3712 RepID=A0A3P6CGF9_BRAOL|nr:unnamed protein product [Brassica oleracea]
MLSFHKLGIIQQQGGPGASVPNAEAYVNNLRLHVNKNGSPRRPGKAIETYIFAMFDENEKPNDETERHDLNRNRHLSKAIINTASIFVVTRLGGNFDEARILGLSHQGPKRYEIRASRTGDL